MRRRQRSLGETLTRSLALSGLVYAAVILYAVPATLLADAPSATTPADPGASSLSATADHLAWRASYAARFPDCVDMAEWAGADVPKTVVVVHRDGSLGRMTFDEAFDRATSRKKVDDVWTVGACR
jgi:hypothetical protein